jgi:tetratricopeptide (TPR) repeat protein
MSFRTRVLIIAALAVLVSPFLIYKGYRYLNPNARKQDLLRSAQKYAREGRPREAAIQYLNVINMDPRFTQAHYELARVALMAGDSDTAFFEFEQTIEQDPQNLDAQVQYGNLLLSRGDIQEAKKKADLVLDQQPDNLDAIILNAQVLAYQGDLPGAEKQLNRARELSPKRVEPLLVLGNLRVQANRDSDGEQLFKQALELDPKNLDALLALGRLYQQTSRYKEAEEYFRKATEIAPADASPRVSLMVLYLVQGRNSDAKQVAETTMHDLSDNPVAYRLLADYYIGVNDPANAIKEMAVLLKKYPRDWQLKRDYVQQLILADRLDEASDLTDELLRIQANNVQTLVQQGQILLKRGKPEQAVVPLKNALRINSNNYTAHVMTGLAFSSLGDMEGAEREFRAAISLQPRRAQAQILLTDLAARKGDTKLLAQMAQRMMQNYPNSAVGFITQGTLDYAAGDIPSADANFRKAIAAEPNNPLPYSKLAELRMVKKDYAEADNLIEQALAKDPAYVPAVRLLVALYGLDKRTDKIIARVSEQIAKVPQISDYYSILGDVQLHQNKFQDSVQSLTKAIELDKKNQEAWELLGKAHAAAGSMPEAISTYEQWSKSDPYQAKSHILLGQIFEGQKEWEKAQVQYRQALDISPDNGIAANNLAFLMLEHNGDIQTALGLAVKARRAMPDNPTVLDTVGWAYYYNGDYRTASKILTTAITLNPNSASAHYHLGRSLQRLRDWTTAKAHYEKALELDPKSSKVDDIRRAIQETQNQQGGIGKES